MPLRLTTEEERPFAPFVLALAAGVGGLVVYDLIFWLQSTGHGSTVVHAPGYGVFLLLIWVAMAWAARSALVRSAWLVLALNEVLSLATLAHPDWSPWWRRDVLLIVWAALLGRWAWSQSAPWVRFVSVLILVAALFGGQLALDVPRKAPIVRQVPQLRPK